MAESASPSGAVRLALTTLTVLPLRPGAAPLNRATAGVAMSLAPVVGVGLGVVVAATGLLVQRAGAPAFVAAVVAVGAAAAFTRGLHLDGLADTIDGLGSYGDAERALAIMRKPDVGPFGVVALVLTLLAQVGAVSALLGREWWSAGLGIVAAVAVGRVAISDACRRGVPAARPDGLGALVAGTVRTPAVLVGAVLVAALAVPAVPGRGWLGPTALVVGLAAATVLRRHATRRFGGVTGDVLGAVCEVASTVTYLCLSM